MQENFQNLKSEHCVYIYDADTSECIAIIFSKSYNLIEDKVKEEYYDDCYGFTWNCLSLTETNDTIEITV